MSIAQVKKAKTKLMAITVPAVSRDIHREQHFQELRYFGKCQL